MSAQLVGATALSSSCDRAADQLDHLDTAAGKTAGLIVSVARSAAPHLTGHLSGTGRSSVEDGRAVVRFTAPYAAVIHWGWRARRIRETLFASRAAQRTESQWVPLYEAQVAEIIGNIQGA